MYVQTKHLSSHYVFMNQEPRINRVVIFITDEKRPGC